MTKQKKLMLDIFNSDFCCGKHRTAEELLDRAKELMPGISRATVYNNLHALESEGVIRKITAEGGADFYDSSNLLHGHLVCKRCGMVNDVELPQEPQPSVSDDEPVLMLDSEQLNLF